MTPESLKGKIKHIAQSRALSSQEVLQMFFFERFLERVSHSKYKENFVIKGGLLIASLLGIANRTTMDMDTTIKGIPLKEEVIQTVISEISNVDVGDGIHFEMTEISYIREADKYDNFRIHLIATFGKIKNPMKIDITTGDVITPEEIEYDYPCLFRKERLKILAYPIETILAEKYETIIKRNISTTRMRDFYDLYSLYYLRKEEIDFGILRQAVLSTARHRESLSYLQEAEAIIEDIKEDSYLKALWNVYLKDNPYIQHLAFMDTIEVVSIIAKKINV